ncbi:MAG: hypothetical protein Q9169_007953 [Polycauliona sp. 2 TL-2023]
MKDTISVASMPVDTNSSLLDRETATGPKIELPPAKPTFDGNKHPVPGRGSQASSSLVGSGSRHSSPSPYKSNAASKSKSMRRENLWYTFIPAVLTTTVPFIAILGVLLYLVFSRRLETNGLQLPELKLPDDDGDSAAYYVDFSATKLTTLVSWASTVAGLAPGFIMTLVSYRVARRLNRYSEKQQIGKLPTNFQLGLLFEAFEAKLTSLWDTICFLLKTRKLRMNGLLAYTMLFLVIVSTVSTMVWAVDTWLQVTMEAVIVSHISQLNSTPQAYGDKIPESCVASLDRTILMAPEACEGPAYLGDPYQIIMNVSSHRQVMTNTYDGKDFSFLAPAKPRPNVDFKASSFAASSTCKPISRDCDMDFTYFEKPETDKTGGMSFNCSGNFNGYVSFFRAGNTEHYSHSCLNNQAGCAGFLSDRSLNVPFNKTSFDHTLNPATQRYANPFFAGVLGYFIVSDGSTGLHSDPEVSPGVGKWFVLGCEITVYDFTYTFVNNTVAAKNLTLASDEVAAVVRQVITVRDASAYQQFAYNVQLSTFMSNTSGQIASSYARNLEKTLLAWSAASWESVRTEQEQIRQNMLVTRVPKVPLFALVGLCLVFVMLSIVVTIIALLDESGTTTEIQGRLNFFGLVESRLDGAEKDGIAMEGAEEDGSKKGIRGNEDMKVGIVKSERGGWDYVSFF